MKPVSGSECGGNEIILFKSGNRFNIDAEAGGQPEFIVNKKKLIVGYSQNPVDDIDGNSYKTVKIGNQIWMAENLKVTHYQNGDPIPNITNGDEWTETQQGTYCNYDNDENNVETYGRLYNWFSVNDKRGLAPKGWHIPTAEEWQTLIVYLGGRMIAGGKLKEEGTALWISPNGGATNESGFTALPGGYRDYDGYYDAMGGNGCFWSSTESSNSSAWYRVLDCSDSEVSRYGDNKGNGFSVRCIRD
jgi:uncharacterized protein (TIGR02145 family)